MLTAGTRPVELPKRQRFQTEEKKTSRSGASRHWYKGRAGGTDWPLSLDRVGERAPKKAGASKVNRLVLFKKESE